MKKIKISNISSFSCVPYKLLQGLSSIEYTDGTPTENTLKLREGEVDAALIPVVDFAQEGSFVSLDFGMGCRRRTDSMILYANQPLHLLKTIHIYECSRSSMFLLKILLKEKWNISPRFVRHKGYELFNWLGDYEGVLGLHRLPGQINRNFPVVVDLSTAWYRHTGLPFLYLVWATRPGVFDAEQLLTLNDVFHKSARASRNIAQEFSEYYGTQRQLGSSFVGDNRRFYIDEFLLSGLKEFYRRAESQNLIPHSEYNAAKLTLLQRRASQTSLIRSLTAILADASRRKRISFNDALCLAKKASQADLIRAAQSSIQASHKLTHKETIQVKPTLLQQDRSALKNFEKELSQLKDIRLNLPKEWPLPASQTLIGLLRERHKLRLEAYGLRELAGLAEAAEVKMAEVCQQLRQVGLYSLILKSGALPNDQTIEDKALFSDLADAFQAGLKATAQIQIATDQSWVARLKYLGQLRTLQDELNGFLGLEVLSATQTISFDELVRTKIVSQFYFNDLNWCFHSDLEDLILAEIFPRQAGVANSLE